MNKHLFPLNNSENQLTFPKEGAQKVLVNFSSFFYFLLKQLCHCNMTSNNSLFYFMNIEKFFSFICFIKKNEYKKFLLFLFEYKYL